MAKNDILLQHSGQLQTVFTGLSKRLEKRGVNTVELICKLAQPEGEAVLDKLADDCAGFMNDTGIVQVGKNYQLIEPRIRVATPKFSKKDFFGSGMGVNISMGSDFESWVLPEISDEIPAGDGLMLVSRDLLKSMTDAENLKEIGEAGILTPDEGARNLFFNLIKQPNGEEKGFFKTNFVSNVSYLKLKSGETVAVGAFRNSDPRVWHLAAYRLDDDRWFDGSRLFSRS